MRRDSYRDAATLAFVRYGELGGLTADEYKSKLRRGAESELQFFDNELRALKLKENMDKYTAFFDDLYAVEETFGHFVGIGKDYIIDAVRAVYMSPPHKFPPHKEMVYRVREFAMSVPASEKQVYKWLEAARYVYSKKRGLAVDVPPGFTTVK